jgi:hypothetical protein
MVKLGDFAKTRRPYRRSCQRVVIKHLAKDADRPGWCPGH